MWKPGEGRAWGLLLHGVVLLLVTLLARVPALSDPCLTADNQTAGVLLGSSCYFLLAHSLTWTESRLECKVHGGHLAEVSSTAGMAAVRRLVALGAVQSAWLGGVEETSGFVWEDGRPLEGSLDGYPWATGGAIAGRSATARENCVYLDAQTATWWQAACAGLRAHICQFNTFNRNCSTSSTSDILTRGAVCYMVTYTRASWFMARAQCRRLGGHLVHLGNQTVSTRLINQLKGAPLYNGQQLWIGLRKSRWVWATGAEIVTSFWEQSEPAGDATCLAAHKYSEDALWWKTQYCSAALQPICQQEQSDIETSTPDGKTTPPKRGNGLQNGLLFLLIVLLLIIGIIITFLVCYYVRGKALQEQARLQGTNLQSTQRQGSHTAGEQLHTNFSIFTTLGQQASMPATTGHRQTKEHARTAHNQLMQTGKHGSASGHYAIVQNNNVPKNKVESKYSLNNAVNKRKSANKDITYQDPSGDDTYDSTLEDAGKFDKSSDSGDAVFKDIGNFDPPVSAHRDAEPKPNRDADRYKQRTGKAGPLPKRNANVYQSVELFAVRNSMNIQLPVVPAESLVMESIQADDYDDNNDDGVKRSQCHDLDKDTDRSRYIEDVARAFDFLVSGANDSPEAKEENDIRTSPSAVTNEAERVRLHSRARRDSSRSMGKSEQETGPIGSEDVTMGKHQLHAGKERTGNRGTKKSTNGYINGGYSVTEGEMDSDKRGQKKQMERSTRDGVTTMGGNSSRVDESRKRSYRQQHQRSKGKDDDMKVKRESRKEQEKQSGSVRDKNSLADEEKEHEIRLTQVGKSLPLGRLPPLAPSGPQENLEDSQQREPRKHKKDMTPAEYEEAKRKHKQRKEKRRRKAELLEASENKVGSNSMRVQGKLQETNNDSDDFEDFAESGGESRRRGSMRGIPKKSFGTGARPKEQTHIR